MGWLFWAILSALFAAATALLAKVGVEKIDSNLATAIRTTVVLVFTWGIALGMNAHHGIGEIGRRSWIFRLRCTEASAPKCRPWAPIAIAIHFSSTWCVIPSNNKLRAWMLSAAGCWRSSRA